MSDSKLIVSKAPTQNSGEIQTSEHFQTSIELQQNKQKTNIQDSQPSVSEVYARNLSTSELLKKLLTSLETHMFPKGPEGFKFNLSDSEVAVQQEFRTRYPKAPDQVQLTWLESEIKRTESKEFRRR